MRVYFTGNGKIELGKRRSRELGLAVHGGCLDDRRSEYCDVHGKKDRLRAVIWTVRSEVMTRVE